MTDPPPVSDRPPDRAEPRGRALHAAAFGLLLAVVAARCFLGELPFTTSTLQFVPRGATARSRPAPGGAGHGAAGRDEADGRDATYRADTNDLARMTFAVLLLATVALWLAGGALAGRLAVRHGYLAILIVVFAVLSLASGFLASNKREALNGWVEQVSLLAACFLAIQLCTSRRRFVLLAAVLAGVGAALAVKGLSQYFVEIPEHVRDFQAHRVERLRAFGWEPDTPQARLVEGRLRSQAITGFGPLANPFASLLLVLLFAGAGLGIDKLRAALASRRSRPAGRRKGDVDLPILAAALTLAAAVPVGLAVVLTRSRGGTVSAAAALAALAAIWLFRRRLAKHWRKALLAALGVFAAGSAGLVAYGLATDRLPTRTMTFRWHYWTASAEILGRHPVLGIGPGNFAASYLRHRRDEAEEEVRMPHNAVLHALTQYGLPGGACYLAILVSLLVGCARPRRTVEDEPPEAPDPPHGRRRTAAVLAAVAAATLLARALFSDAAMNAYYFVLEGVVPVLVLAAMLALAAWWPGRPRRGGLDGLRIALGCGAAGFLLHNLVTFSLWLPGAAGVFYVAAGAGVARSGGGRGREVIAGRLSAALLVAFVAAAVAATCVGAAATCWVPAFGKRLHAGRMLAALRRGDTESAWLHARDAAGADPLGAQIAADAADVGLRHVLDRGQAGGLRAAGPGDAMAKNAVADEAFHFAERAVRRDPFNASYWRHAANVAWAILNWRHPAGADLVEHGNAAHQNGATRPAELLWSEADAAFRAVPASKLRQVPGGYLLAATSLNPKSPRLRVNYGQVLCDAGRAADCLRQISEALRLDDRLPPDSLEHFTPAEMEQIATLRARARFLLNRGSR